MKKRGFDIKKGIWSLGITLYSLANFNAQTHFKHSKHILMDAKSLTQGVLRVMGPHFFSCYCPSLVHS